MGMKRARVFALSALSVLLSFTISECREKTNDDSEVTKLLQTVITDVNKLTYRMHYHEKASSRRLEIAVDHITQNLQIQTLKMSKELESLKKDMMNRFESVEKSFSRKLKETRMDVGDDLINLKKKMNNAIKEVKEETVHNLKTEARSIIKAVTKKTERDISKEMTCSNNELTKMIKDLRGDTLFIKRSINDEMKILKGEMPHIRSARSARSILLKKRNVRLTMNSNRARDTMKEAMRDDAIQKQNVRISKLEKVGDVSRELKKLNANVGVIKSRLTGPLPGKDRRNPAKSCRDLFTHNYNIEDGYYWIAGKRKPTYCDMKNRGGGTYSSCKLLKQNHPHLPSGYYRIDLGELVEVYCDMKTDGGGWLQMGSAVVNKDSEKTEVDNERLFSDDITSLTKVKSNRFLLGRNGMKELQKHTKFTEIRFHCTKKWHGRTVDIKTDKSRIDGQQAVKFLLGVNDETPHSCHSYKRLRGDSSRLASDCEQWGYGSEKGIWNEPDMYNYPFYSSNDGKYSYFTLISGYLQCDDNVDERGFDSVGSWSYYVR